jgi:hypothetical protein
MAPVLPGPWPEDAVDVSEFWSFYDPAEFIDGETMTLTAKVATPDG